MDHDYWEKNRADVLAKLSYFCIRIDWAMIKVIMLNPFRNTQNYVYENMD